jgi:hypothetical protein
MLYSTFDQERYDMAERTKGGGFRERIYFDDTLWQEIQAVAVHMRLEPRELVKMLTAMGLAQMKGLTMMHQMQGAIEPVIQQVMVDDFERMAGMSADTAVMGNGPARTAPTQSTAMSAPGRNPVQKTELARSDGPPSYFRGL